MVVTISYASTLHLHGAFQKRCDALVIKLFLGGSANFRTLFPGISNDNK